MARPTPTTLTAANCPSPQVFTGPLILISDNAVGSNPPTIPHALPLATGNGASTLVNWNSNACRLDLGGSVYAIPLGVCFGLSLSAGSGLSVAIAAGHANVNGIVEIAAATSTVVQASTRNWVWLKQNG